MQSNILSVGPNMTKKLRLAQYYASLAAIVGILTSWLVPTFGPVYFLLLTGALIVAGLSWGLEKEAWDEFEAV